MGLFAEQQMKDEKEGYQPLSAYRTDPNAS